MVDRCATIAIVADFDIDTGASGRLTEVIGLGVLTRLIDRDTVDEVLAKADRRETRVRLLPARVVVYLVLALCLFSEDGYDEVVRKLTNGLRGRGSGGMTGKYLHHRRSHRPGPGSGAASWPSCSNGWGAALLEGPHAALGTAPLR